LLLKEAEGIRSDQKYVTMITMKLELLFPALLLSLLAALGHVKGRQEHIYIA
jgi:hypothetical protein